MSKLLGIEKEIKYFYDILDSMYESGLENKNNALRFVKFLIDRGYLTRRDWDRNTIGWKIQSSYVGNELCLRQLTELQQLAFGEGSISDILNNLFCNEEYFVSPSILEDFFRRKNNFFDIIYLEEPTGQVRKYEELLLFNSYVELKFLETIAKKYCRLHNAVPFKKYNISSDSQKFLSSLPVFVGVDNLDKFEHFKSTVDTFMGFIDKEYCPFDGNSLIIKYLSDINSYSTPEMLLLISSMDEFLKDYNDESFAEKESLERISKNLNDSFMNRNNTSVYYCSSLAYGNRFEYLNGKLWDVEKNLNIRNEIFNAIKRIDYRLFEYLGVSSEEDSFINIFDMVFDSDTYEELFAKLYALEKASSYVVSASYESCDRMISSLKDGSCKEKINGEEICYPINTMNKITKPVKIIDRIKYLYGKNDDVVNVIDIIGIHAQSSSHFDFKNRLECEIADFREKQKSLKTVEDSDRIQKKSWWK